jgi:lysozyme family protein
VADDASPDPLSGPAASIRDAAKYLVAAFGAVGALLVANLSLSALPNGAHPWLAALAIAVAVVALAVLIGMVVSVLTPHDATLGTLAELQKRRPNDRVIQRLRGDPTLFQGQPANLVELRDTYAKALDARARAQMSYLASPTTAREQRSKIADARVQFLDQAVGQVLGIAVFYQLQERFSPMRRLVMTALALVVVAAAAGYAWAVAKPDPAPAAKPTPSAVVADYFAANLAAFRGPGTLHAGVGAHPLCLVRYYDRARARTRGDDPGATWWTSCRYAERLRSIAEVRRRLALPRAWGARDALVVAEVPAGTRIAYLSGRAAPLCEPDRSTCYAGGGAQLLFVDRSFERTWFVRRECARRPASARASFGLCAG